MEFKPDFNPQLQGTDTDFWFIIDAGKIMVKQDDDVCSIPEAHEIRRIRKAFLNKQYFGILDNTYCFYAEWPETLSIPDNMVFKEIRELFPVFSKHQIITAGCAIQLVRWDRIHRYCGQCGKPLRNKTDERAKVCRVCDLVTYPRLSPAIIVAVIKNGKILLARSGRFPLPFYSVLAGFVEPGETLEACVAREVYEEVGIKVKNIRYFKSQPWPFPDSLMIGFTAEYAEGEIKIDGAEIEEAGWYSSGDLPMVPPKVSIARQLIDWYIETYG